MHISSSDFRDECNHRIKANDYNYQLKESASKFFLESVKCQYSYNFTWMGLPIIQYPQDLVALQEIIFKTKPNIIIETGFARGGSAMFLLSMLSLTSPHKSNQNKLLSIDISFNTEALEAVQSSHFSSNFHYHESSSSSSSALEFANSHIGPNDRVMVILDSMHTSEHVSSELSQFAPLVSQGCYCVVLDTVIDKLPDDCSADRPWGPGNSPLTAVSSFLNTPQGKSFQIDKDIDSKLMISVGVSGYLYRS